jgi:hypothetical protein
MQRKYQNVWLVILFETVHEGFLFRKEAKSVPISQCEAKIIQHSEIRLQDKDLRTGFSH